MTTEPTELIGTHKGRPTLHTPYGVLFTDTEAFSRYAEMVRISDWLNLFLLDLEHLRIDAPAAVKRIEDFWSTLQPCHGSLKADVLARIRTGFAGEAQITLGPQLRGLHIQASHASCSVRNIAQDCESVPTGQEIPYGGPFPRESGDHTPAFGYHRALADSRY